MPARSFRRPIVAISLCTVLAACGGSSSSTVAPGASTTNSAASTAVDAATYAEGLCTSIGGWIQSLQDGNDSYQQAIGGASPSLHDVKDALTVFVDDTVAKTDVLLDEVRSLGTPDVDNGEQVASDILAGLQGARDLYGQLQEDVAGLSVDDQATMTQELQTLTANLQAAPDELGNAFDSIDNTELKAAAQDIPACQSLAS